MCGLWLDWTQIRFVIAVGKIGEHVIDVVDSHIHGDDRWAKFAISDAGGGLEAIFEESLEVQLKGVCAAVVTGELQGLLLPQGVEEEQMGDDLSAGELRAIDFDPKGVCLVGEGLKGWEKVLHQRVVETDVVVPAGREEQRKGRTPICVIVAAEHHLHYHFLSP